MLHVDTNEILELAEEDIEMAQSVSNRALKNNKVDPENRHKLT